jgi:hypothetical protein
MSVQPFQTVQNGAAFGNDGAAKVSGDHAAPAAFKKPAAQPGFKPRERAGQRRLGNAQHPGGADQAAMLIYGLDQPKFPDLNHIPPVELQIAKKVLGMLVAKLAIFASM